MRSTLRDALGSLVDDRRAHETERRTRAQPAEKAPPWWRHSSLLWPTRACSPGTWAAPRLSATR
jgi:hypothetical protein